MTEFREDHVFHIELNGETYDVTATFRAQYGVDQNGESYVGDRALRLCLVSFSRSPDLRISSAWM